METKKEAEPKGLLRNVNGTGIEQPIKQYGNRLVPRGMLHTVI